MQLSERLKKVISFVDACECAADIGTDHGYVPIALVKQGIVKKAYAMDVNEGPLLRARANIKAEGLEDFIEVRQSDGLSKLAAGDADTLILAGMGGELTVRILKNGKTVADSAKTLILSPHSEVFLVRKYLLSEKFEIIREEMIKDAGKYYTVIKAGHQKDSNLKPYDEAEYLYGRLLMRQADPVLWEYLTQAGQKYQKIQEELKVQNSETAVLRRKEIAEELAFVLEAKRRIGQRRKEEDEHGGNV